MMLRLSEDLMPPGAERAHRDPFDARHGVFVDYNQNARDRTVASAYSVRPTADARISAPLSSDKVDTMARNPFHFGS